MTWRRRIGIVTAGVQDLGQVAEFFDAESILGIIEAPEAAFETLQVAIATNDDGALATLDGDTVVPGLTLEEFGQRLADHVIGEVSFAQGSWVGEELEVSPADPFEQPLGADIADYADRAVVFTRAPQAALEGIAGQVDDVLYAVPHTDGHALCITEGPIPQTLQWDEETRPVVIIEHGAADPSLTVISEGEPHEFIWASTRTHTPRVLPEPQELIAHAFTYATIGTGALVREVMKVLPAIEPGGLRAALETGLDETLSALGLPGDLRGYLASETDAAELPGAEAIHPASFARSVRRVATSVTERAEAVRQRAVDVRTRAETAFDAAEAFAEDVVLPVRQNWVSPALAVTETTLGVLALRKARRLGGWGAGALGTGGVLLLGDAVVNTVISVAPLLRRKN